MKTSTKIYLILAAAGVLLAAAAILFKGALTDAQTGAALGVGAGLIGFGLAKFFVGRYEEKNPELFKLKVIEEKDERNQIIRSKAQAVSGEIIHWTLMAGAWIAMALDAPLWVTLAFVGVFLLKTALDIAFMAYYQKRM